MSEIQFLLALQKTKKSYKWHLQGNKIRGVARNGKDKGEMFDPLTALSRYNGKGLSSTLTNTVIFASDAKSNRGGGQVLRGRIKQVLDI